MEQAWSLLRTGHPSVMELVAYLGDKFRLDWFNSTDAKVADEAKKYADMQSFYAESDIYLYHLLIAFLEGWKRPCFAHLLSLTAGMGAVTVLDYGCGIGCDGLWLLDAGYRVSFADVAGQSLDFLRWRLWTRRYVVPVYEIDATRFDEQTVECPRAQIVWCMDVLEHLPEAQQRWLLHEQLPRLGDIVFVNLVDDHEADGVVHYALDIEDLTQGVCTQWQGQCFIRDFYTGTMAHGGKIRLLGYGNGMVADSFIDVHNAYGNYNLGCYHCK